MNNTPPPLPRKDDSLGDNAGVRMLLPVGRSGYAITAGYLALFSVLIVPAPLALLFGILGVHDIRKSRSQAHKKHGMGRAIFGIVMGALGSVILVLFLMSALFG